MDSLVELLSVELLSYVLYGIVLLSAGMWPLGIMLGSSCSPCCGQASNPCSLSNSVPSFPSVTEQYACDNDLPAGAPTLGISGANASGLAAYFNSNRNRPFAFSPSLARGMSCENVCDIRSLAPTYSFAGAVPTVTITLSFNGNTTEYRPYYSKFRGPPEPYPFENHCYVHTTISRASGTYELSHVGGGVFRYQTASLFGNDLFEVTASLHRCNDTPMWLISVAFVSRTVDSYCRYSSSFSQPDPSRCTADGVVGLITTKILRCCLGHVLHQAAACVRTTALFSDRVQCSEYSQGQVNAALTIDATERSQLSVSGNFVVNQMVTTSGNDIAYGNPYGRPGIRMPETKSPTANVTYAGSNAPCFCLDRVHTFKNAMTFATTYGGPFTLSVT